MSLFDAGSVLYEIARWDASIATFMIVHNCLGISVVERLGNEEQKQRVIPGKDNFIYELILNQLDCI